MYTRTNVKMVLRLYIKELYQEPEYFFYDSLIEIDKGIPNEIDKT